MPRKHGAHGCGSCSMLTMSMHACTRCMQALGMLLELCTRTEPACTAALAAVCAITQRHLAASDWLPLLDQVGALLCL